MTQLSGDVRSAIRLFAFYLANGTLVPEVLAGVDYRSGLLEFGSYLESIFAVFSNVLDVDADGKVTNHAHAQRRASQLIRQQCDPTYEPKPPFEVWETALAEPISPP